MRQVQKAFINFSHLTIAKCKDNSSSERRTISLAEVWCSEGRRRDNIESRAHACGFQHIYLFSIISESFVPVAGGLCSAPVSCWTFAPLCEAVPKILCPFPSKGERWGQVTLSIPVLEDVKQNCSSRALGQRLRGRRKEGTV